MIRPSFIAPTPNSSPAFSFGLTLVLSLAGVTLLDAPASATAPTPKPSPFHVQCQGKADAPIRAVYLHGKDSPEFPSAVEVANRKAMAAIDEDIGLRVALVRSDRPCADNGQLRCWPQKSVEELNTMLTQISNAAVQCFPPNTSYGLIGFSDGGALANRLVQYCQSTPFDWIISMGAAGGWRASDPRDLRKCEALQMILLKDDSLNNDEIQGYYRHLKSVRARVKLLEVKGPRGFPADAMQALLTKLTGKSRAPTKPEKRASH